MRKVFIILLSSILLVSFGIAQTESGGVIPQKHKKQCSKTAIKAGYISTKNSILDESFEDGIPADWSLYTMEDPSTWTTTTDQAHTGTTSAYHEDIDAVCDNWLVTPQLTIDNAAYFFKVWQYEVYSTYYETHEIVVSTGSGDPADGDFTSVIYEGAGAEETWEEIVVSLAEFEGLDIYIGFHYIGEYADQWSIDDLTVSTVSLHDLGVTEINFTSTILNFENRAIISLHNYASSTESGFELNLTIMDENAVIVFNETETVGSIAPNGDLDSEIFLSGIDELGVYSVTATVILPEDENLANNILTGSMEMVEQGWFIPEIDSPVDQYLGSSAIDPDNMDFYCLGGNPDGVKVYIFDYDMGEWSTGADLPAYSSLGGAAYANGKIYAHRGDGGAKADPTSDFWRYDISTDTWTIAASSPVALRWVKMISNPDNNYLYLVGGRTASATVNTIYAYNIQEDTWSEASSMPIAAFGSSVVFQDGKLFVIGGYDENNNLLSEVQIGTFSESNPLSITWSTESANYPMPIYKAQAATFGDGKIIVAGGTDASVDVWTPVADTYLYDIEEDVWIQQQDQVIPILGGFEGTAYIDPSKEEEVITLLNVGGYDGSNIYTGFEAFIGFYFNIPAVTDLVCTILPDANSVDLSWDFDGFPNFEQFNIYRSSDGVNFEIIGTSLSESYEDIALENGYYYYKVTAVCDGEEGPESNIAEIDIWVSISEYGIALTNVFPNPTKEKINIQSADNIKNLKVFDIYGRSIRDIYPNTKQYILNVEELKGTYMLQIQTNKGVEKMKIIVN